MCAEETDPNTYLNKQLSDLLPLLEGKFPVEILSELLATEYKEFTVKLPKFMTTAFENYRMQCGDNSLRYLIEEAIINHCFINEPSRKKLQMIRYYLYTVKNGLSENGT